MKKASLHSYQCHPFSRLFLEDLPVGNLHEESSPPDRLLQEMDTQIALIVPKHPSNHSTAPNPNQAQKYVDYGVENRIQEPSAAAALKHEDFNEVNDNVDQGEQIAKVKTARHSQSKLDK